MKFKYIAKALYELKHTKQILATIMAQTLMHNQKSYLWPNMSFCGQIFIFFSSQVREIMNVDPQS